MDTYTYILPTEKGFYYIAVLAGSDDEALLKAIDATADINDATDPLIQLSRFEAGRKLVLSPSQREELDKKGQVRIFSAEKLLPEIYGYRHRR